MSSTSNNNFNEVQFWAKRCKFYRRAVKTCKEAIAFITRAIAKGGMSPDDIAELSDRKDWWTRQELEDDTQLKYCERRFVDAQKEGGIR